MEGAIGLRDKLLSLYDKYMTLAGIAGHSIYVFQTYKMISCCSSSNVSFEGFFVSFLSVSSWLVYGFLKKDKVLVTVNIFGLIASVGCLTAIILLQ